MSIPSEIAATLSEEAVGAALLVELDTSEGFLRFLFGDDGVFVDVDGVEWIGSLLLKIGDVERNSDGVAPSWEVSLSYVHDPARGEDLIAAIRQYGVAAIDGRPARLYFQYFSQTGEMFAPVHVPVRISTHTMRKLNYSIDGPQARTVSVICEGPYPLRSKPVNGRYTDADQRRRGAGDPSLEFMPVHGFDDQSLFGI